MSAIENIHQPEAPAEVTLTDVAQEVRALQRQVDRLSLQVSLENFRAELRQEFDQTLAAIRKR